MSLVKLKDKRSGTTYVYESESYWDKEKKQPRSRRKLIGKLDEETGEIVPTGKSGGGEGFRQETGRKRFSGTNHRAHPGHCRERRADPAAESREPGIAQGKAGCSENTGGAVPEAFGLNHIGREYNEGRQGYFY